MDQPVERIISHAVDSCMCVTVRAFPRRSLRCTGFPTTRAYYNKLIGPLAPQWVARSWTGWVTDDQVDAIPQNSLPPTANARSWPFSTTWGSIRWCWWPYAAGPEAIDFAVTHPERVARLVLLNTYYGRNPNVRLPEMIALMADPALASLTDALLDDPAIVCGCWPIQDSVSASMAAFPTVLGSIRSFRNFSETPASPMRWPKCERGPPPFRRPSTGRTTQSLPADCRSPPCRCRSSSAATTRT